MFYTKEAIVADYDCDYSCRIKPSAAMRYMQQTSAEHLISLGLPYEKLLEENMVFLMSKSCNRFFEMPKAGQKILVSTAATAVRGARYVREFTVDDVNGNRLISSLTLWILVNPATRRVLRPGSFPYNIPFSETAVEGHISDLDIPKEKDGECSVFEFSASYSNIDCNGHVNNSYYADFICDSLPPEPLIRGELDILVISFQNEARLGDKLLVKREALSPQKYHLWGTKNGSAACFEAYTAFR